MVEVHLRAVRVDLGSSTPVVLLEETEGARRSLPIFVGGPEATAIAFALQGVEPPRPMSHDLMRELVEALGAKVVRVLVTELRDGTFFAELHLRSGERDLIVSCRPSDAIALATRTRSPLYVSDELMEAEGLVIEPDDDDVTVEGNPDELVGEFREFLDRIRPRTSRPEPASGSSRRRSQP
jgi:bifunctional DNase/RNase